MTDPALEYRCLHCLTEVHPEAPECWKCATPFTGAGRYDRVAMPAGTAWCPPGRRGLDRPAYGAPFLLTGNGL